MTPAFPGALPWVGAAVLFGVWWRSSRIPGRTARVGMPAVIGIAVFTALCVYPAQRLKDYNFFFGDEGLEIAVAQAITDGAVLYRDVWEFLQPGSFVALAAVFAVFGSGVGVLDLCALGLFGACAAVMYRLVAQHASPRAGWLCVVAFLLALHPLGVWLSPHWMSTCSALVAIACVLSVRPPGNVRHLLAAGVSIGVTFLFQQHKGVFLATTLGPAYLVACVACRATPRDTLRAGTALLGGALLAGVPLVGWLTWHGLWGEWWYATFTWVREGYGPANATRPQFFPVTSGLSVARLLHGFWLRADVTVLRFLPLVYVIAPVALLWRGAAVERWRLWLVWAGALGVFGTALTRYEDLRLMYTAPATLALAAFLAAHVRAVWPPARRGVTHLAGAAALGAGVALLCLAAAQQYASHMRLLAAGDRVTIESPRGRVTLWAHGWGDVHDARTVIGALQGLPPETTLFVYPSGAGFEYLSGLRNGTPYHFVLPGYTRPAQWARLHAAFDANRVDVIVWDRTFNAAWMAQVYPTLPPDSVWDNSLVRMLAGPDWAVWLETRTLVVYRRVARGP